MKLFTKKKKSNNNKLVIISRNIYNKYKTNDSIPIECLINICLLLNGIRKIIQFDKYLYNNTIWNNIKLFLNDPIINKYLVITTDKLENGKNIVIYVKNNKLTTEIQNKGLSNIFGNMLDTDFYKHCEFDRDKKKTYISRVSINVIGPVNPGINGQILRHKNYFGQILLMECKSSELEKNIKHIYNRFEDYKKYIWNIDKNLQLTLEIYSKNGIWENQPFLKTNTLTYTD